MTEMPRCVDCNEPIPDCRREGPPPKPGVEEDGPLCLVCISRVLTGRDPVKRRLDA